MFFLIVLSIFLGGYAYAAWRANAGLGIKYPYNWHIFASFMLLAVLGVLGAVFARQNVPVVSQLLGPLGFMLAGVWGIMVTFFILNDIVNLANLIFKIKDFRYWSTMAALCLSAVACVWAMLNVALVLNLKEVRVKVPELSVPSLRIVLLSDIHITTFTSPESIKKIFAKAQSLNPDIIVITGDIADTDIRKNDRYKEYGFETLKAPLGVFAVAGNHEHYAGLNDFFEMFKNLGIRVLRNENVFAGNMINVAGINDSSWNNADNINKTLSQAVPGYPVIFLSHRPESFNIAARHDGIIQLSGHTHAGQIPPTSIARMYFMKYNYGLYKIGKSVMYVTSGARWWGPAMRLFKSSEIPVIILEK